MTVAELLGVPAATFARKVEVADGGIRVERQTEAGYDVVESALPALVDRDGRRDRTALPDPQGHHGGEVEAAGNSCRSPTSGSPRPMSPRPSGWSPSSRRPQKGPGDVIDPATRPRPRRRPPGRGEGRSDVAKVWVFAEVAPEGPTPAALELLAKARELGDAEAVALGPGATAAAGALGDHGARTGLRERRPGLRRVPRRSPPRTRSHALVREHTPDLILFATTYASRDVAGRLQAKTGTTLMSNAIDVASADAARTADRGRDAVRRRRARRPRAPSRARAAEVVRRGARRGNGRGRAGRRRDPRRAQDGPPRRAPRGDRRPARSSRRPGSSSPAGAGCRTPSNFSLLDSSPRRSATPRSAPAAPSSTRAGSPTAIRSDRPARR